MGTEGWAGRRVDRVRTARDRAEGGSRSQLCLQRMWVSSFREAESRMFM